MMKMLVQINKLCFRYGLSTKYGADMKYLQQAIEEYQTKIRTMDYPSCFDDSSHWEDWLRLEEDAQTEPRQFPCRDCTLDYQYKMRVAGRCLVPDVSVEYIARQRG